MAQRWQPSSGPGNRDQQRKFFCELCNKGYARQSDLTNHESDYDHQHRKREKDRKQLSKDMNAEAKAKSAEQRESGIRTISLATMKSSSGGSKAPVFKVVGQSEPQKQSAQTLMLEQKLNPSDPSTATMENDPSGAVRNGWYSDRYDPTEITGCDESCSVCHGREDVIRL